jgi:hypothetical protein
MPIIYLYPRSRLESGLRFEAEFYQQKYLELAKYKCEWRRIGSILSFCQYGSSLPLNEDGDGYPIFHLN